MLKKIEEKSKKISVVWGFDNNNQLDNLELSIESLVNSNLKNKENIELIFFLNIFENKENVEIAKRTIQKNTTNWDVKFISLEEGSGAKDKNGQFYYLYSPFYSSSDFSLCLDNDTFINCDVLKMIDDNSGVLSDNDISAVMTEPVKTFSHLQGLIKIKGEEYYENWKHKWFNSGITIINNKLWNEFYNCDQSILWRKINDYSILNSKNGFEEADETFILMNHVEKLGELSKKYNVRLHVLNTIDNLESGEYIFHFMTRYFNNELNKWIKFDWKYFFKSADTNENKIKKLLEFWENLYWIQWEHNEIINPALKLLVDSEEMRGKEDER